MEAPSALVGTKFQGRPAVDAAAEMHVGEAVLLKREPRNSFDRNAIACHFLEVRCGYLPRAVSERMAPIMDRGVAVVATVTRAPSVVDGKMKSEPMLRLTWEETAP